MKTFAPLIAGLVLVTAPDVPSMATARAPSAGVIADGFLARFNAGQPTDYETFLRDHWPGLEDAGEYADRRAQTGGYDLVQRQVASARLSVEVLKERLSDDYVSYRVETGEGPQRFIKSLTFTPADRPAGIAPPQRVSALTVGRELDRQLQAMGDFSGAVLIAQGGRPVYARAGGLADRKGVANTLDTRFRIASMGKMFTAVAIMQLNQAGKLDLDATVGSILTDYPNADFARTVTLRHLLTHTGGAGDFMSKMWADHYLSLNTAADYIALFGTRPPEFKPGSRFSYANYGYIVLGRIVEVASGQTYEAYLRDHVFRPAGMTHSGLNEPPDQASVLATSYVKTANGFAPPPAPFLGAATPAGGAYTTVGDLLSFATALTGHHLLDAGHTDLLLSPKVKGDSSLYAYGFEVRSADGVDDVGHDGGGPGQNGGFRILDHGKAVVVALSNVAPTWRADKLCGFIARRIRLD